MREAGAEETGLTGSEALAKVRLLAESAGRDNCKRVGAAGPARIPKPDQLTGFDRVVSAW